MRRVDKPWGYELIWAENPLYVGKILKIMASKRLSLQYHRIKDETIRVQQGTLRLEVGSNKENLAEIMMQPGDCYRIEPGTLHRMSAVTDCEVVEVSTSDLDDVIRVQDDFGRK